jgi:cap1 methyltransferase
MEKAKKFVRAISRPTRSDLAPIRVKELVRFEQIENVFPSLQMKVIKGSGHMRKLCYCCPELGGGDQSRYIVPTGLLVIRIVNDPWMMAISKSQNRKYYYHTITHKAIYETPKDSVASYLQCLKSRLFWQWDDNVVLCDGQTASLSAAASKDALSKDTLIRFIHEKLG